MGSVVLPSGESAAGSRLCSVLCVANPGRLLFLESEETGYFQGGAPP